MFQINKTNERSMDKKRDLTIEVTPSDKWEHKGLGH